MPLVLLILFLWLISEVGGEATIPSSLTTFVTFSSRLIPLGRLENGDSQFARKQKDETASLKPQGTEVTGYHGHGCRWYGNKSIPCFHGHQCHQYLQEEFVSSITVWSVLPVPKGGVPPPPTEKCVCYHEMWSEYVNSVNRSMLVRWYSQKISPLSFARELCRVAPHSRTCIDRRLARVHNFRWTERTLNSV